MFIKGDLCLRFMNLNHRNLFVKYFSARINRGFKVDLLCTEIKSVLAGSLVYAGKPYLLKQITKCKLLDA